MNVHMLIYICYVKIYYFWQMKIIHYVTHVELNKNIAFIVLFDGATEKTKQIKKNKKNGRFW